MVYLLVAWIAGFCVVRDALGPIAVPAALIGNETAMGDINNTLLTVTGIGVTVQDEAAAGVKNETEVLCKPGMCHYGLLNNMQVMQTASVFGPITIAGIVSATLSSALASIISAPRVFQVI